MFKYRCDPFISIKYNNRLHVKTKILGKYNINNIIASIKIATLFKISNQQIKKSLENIELKNNRSEFINTNKNNILLDAYNANPTSMSIGIVNFIESSKFLEYTNTLFILGDMLELGSYSQEEHQAIINQLKKGGIQQVILVGPIFCASKTTGFTAFENSTAAKNHLDKQLLQDYTILIKGSRGIALEQLLDHL